MKKIFTLILSACMGATFAQVTSQTFTSNGNFVVPPGITSVTVTVIGAGGNGASNGGGGGGGGGAATGVYAVTSGATIPVVIGAAGGGSVTSITSFSNVIFGTGGQNGTTVANPNIGGGGLGGNGSGGISNWVGGNGGGGYWTYFGGGGGGAAGPAANGGNGGNTIAWTGVCQTPGGTGGLSGGAPAGAGGKGAGFTDPNCSVTDAAANGANYGAGGGGGNGSGGAPGVGANGFCQILYNGCAVPAAPVNTTPPANLVICQSNTTALTVSSTGTVNWFSGPATPNAIGTGTSFTVSPQNTTTYYAETSTCNTSTRTAITVSVNPTPTVGITSNMPALCPGQTAVLTASGASSYTWNTTATTSTLLIYPFTTTTYTVGGSFGNCVGSASITQVVNPLPSLTVTSTSGTICIGQSASLTVSGAVTYSWNTTATGSVIVVSPTMTTLYWVTGTSALNCEDTITFRQYVKDCVVIGINEQSNEHVDFNVYPNPGDGELTISASENLKINLLNQLGQIVQVIELDATNDHKVFLKDLSPGIYFISGANGPGINRKIIVSD